MDQRSGSPIGRSSIGRVHDARGVAMASWDADGTFTEGNQAFLSLIGLNATNLELQRISWESLVTPGARHSQELMRSLLEVAGMAPPFETVWRRSDGTDIPVLVVSATLDRERGCGWLFALDQREQKASEAAITASEERYRLVTRAAGGVLLTSSQMLQSCDVPGRARQRFPACRERPED